MFKTIVVGIDGRQGGQDALALAASLQRRVRRRTRRRARLCARLLPRPRRRRRTRGGPARPRVSGSRGGDRALRRLGPGVRGRRWLARPRPAPRRDRPGRRSDRRRVGAPRACGPRAGRRRDHRHPARRAVPRPRGAARPWRARWRAAHHRRRLRRLARVASRPGVRAPDRGGGRRAVAGHRCGRAARPRRTLPGLSVPDWAEHADIRHAEAEERLAAVLAELGDIATGDLPAGDPARELAHAADRPGPPGHRLAQPWPPAAAHARQYVHQAGARGALPRAGAHARRPHEPAVAEASSTAASPPPERGAGRIPRCGRTAISDPGPPARVTAATGGSRHRAPQGRRPCCSPAPPARHRVRSYHGRDPRPHPDGNTPLGHDHVDHGAAPTSGWHPLRVVVAGAGWPGWRRMVALRGLVGTSRRADARGARRTTSPCARWRCSSPLGSGVRSAIRSPSWLPTSTPRFRRDAVARVERDERIVRLQSGTELTYDRLVLAVGAFPYPAYEHGVCFKRAHDGEAFDRSSPTCASDCRAHRHRRSAGLHVDPARLRARAPARGPDQGARAHAGHRRGRAAERIRLARRRVGHAPRSTAAGSSCWRG